MIPPEKIEEIIARTDISTLVGQYVTLKRAGKNLKGLCPFHREKTPSFNVHPDRGIFKCFGCGVGGGPIQFLMKIENIDFIDAVKILASRAGIPIETTPAEIKTISEKEVLRKILNASALFYQDVLLNNPLGKDAQAYLKKRGLAIKTIADYKLGFAPTSGDFLTRHLRGRKFDYQDMEKAGVVRQGNREFYDYFRGRIIFPISDSQGRVIGLGGRGMDDSVMPKYLNTPETSIFSKRQTLYGLDLAKPAIRKEEEVYVVEGYMDAIALHGAGIENVVASMGTSLTQEQAEGLARYSTRVIFAYDADSAGEAATVRGIEIFEKAGLTVKVISMPAGEDPDSIIKKKGTDFFKELKTHAQSIVDYRLDHFKGRFDLATPEGKQGFVKEIVPLLKGLKGDVRRSEYIRIISERYRLPEEILRQAVAERKLRKHLVDTSPVLKKRKLSPEETLLACLFSMPQLIQICRNHMLTGGFMDPDLFEIYQGLLREDTSNLEVISADFIHRIAKTEEMLKKAVDLSMVEGLPRCNEEEVETILREIENRGIDRLISEKQEAVKRKMAEGTLTHEDPDLQEMYVLQRRRKVPGSR